MLKQLLISVCFIGLYAELACSQSLCGIHYASSSGTLYGTGFDESFNFNLANNSLHFSQSACIGLSNSKSVTSYGGPGFLLEKPIAQYTSSVSYAAGDGNLSLKLTGHGEGGYPYTPSAGGEWTVTWFDRAQLVYEGTTPEPVIGNKLKLFYSFSANLTTDIDGIVGVTSWIDSSASASASLGLQSIGYGVSKNAVYNPTSDDLIISAGLGAEFEMGIDRSFTFAPTLRLDVNVSRGNATADASHTLKFMSITFPDGTTPEQLGYKIVFDSGMTSPNVRVPEPQAAILLTLASFFLLAFHRRSSIHPKAF